MAYFFLGQILLSDNSEKLLHNFPLTLLVTA